MEYDADLFDAQTIDRMLRHLQTLVEGIVADPDKPIGSLPMLTEEESRQLLGGWSGQGDVNSSQQTLADLDQLSEEELDALLDQFEPGNDA